MQIAKYRIFVSVLAVGLGVVGLFLFVRSWKSLSHPIPQLEVAKPAVQDIPGTFYLRTSSVPDDVRIHFLDGDFKIVSRVDEISGNCMQIFESSFVTISGSRAKPGEVTFANPGEAFQASDAIVPGLPFRRLEFAGLGTSKCFIHYQSGGQPSSFCLAVIDYPNQKIVWVGEHYKAARNVDDLRRLLVLGRFRDTLGRGC